MSTELVETEETPLQRSESLVARILHTCHTLEETRDNLIELLPTLRDEKLIEVRMTARLLGVYSWVIEAACDAETLKRIEAQKGGRGNADEDEKGRKAAVRQQAYRDAKSTRTVYRNAQIINTFGRETIATHGTTLQDKGFWIAALTADDPMAAVEVFAAKKADNPFWEVKDAYRELESIKGKPEESRKEAEKKRPNQPDFVLSGAARKYLDKYMAAIAKLTQAIPSGVLSVELMAYTHGSQALWQKQRTKEKDYAAITELFSFNEGTAGIERASKSDISAWLEKCGYYMSDCELNERLDAMVEGKMLQLKSSEESRQENRRGSMVDLYALHPEYESQLESAA